MLCITIILLSLQIPFDLSKGRQALMTRQVWFFQSNPMPGKHLQYHITSLSKKLNQKPPQPYLRFHFIAILLLRQSFRSFLQTYNILTYKE